MRPSLIIPRLRQQVSALGNRVAATAGLAAALESAGALTLPAAFIRPLGDVVEETVTIGRYVQPILRRFAVVVMVSNTSDERGQAAMEQLYDLEADIVAALVGWSPDPALYEGIEYAGIADDPEFDRAVLAAELGFQARSFITQS